MYKQWRLTIISRLHFLTVSGEIGLGIIYNEPHFYFAFDMVFFALLLFFELVVHLVGWFSKNVMENVMFACLFIAICRLNLFVYVHMKFIRTVLAYNS